MAQKADNYASWYRAVPGHENRNIAEEAYKTAVEQLENELRQIDRSLASLDTCSTIGEIQIEIQKAKEIYEQKTKRFESAREWIEVLSVRMMHYARAFDTIASHHQEYVGLAWGAIKLVFMGIANRAELMQKLSEALVALADVLPRTELNAALYPTEAMENAVSRLYVRIILFSVQCVRWYRRSSIGRLWNAVKHPFELYYHDLIDQVKICSDNIDALANVGSRAETRDFNFQQVALITGIDSKLVHMQARFDSLDRYMTNFETKLDDMIKIETANGTLIKRVSGHTHTVIERTFRLEFNQIVQFFEPSTLPETALRTATHLVRHNPSFILPSADLNRIQQLIEAWITAQRSSLLIVKVAHAAKLQARELLTDLLSYMDSLKLDVFWSITAAKGEPSSCADIIKSLIFQILHRRGEYFHDCSEQLNIIKVRSPHSETEWADLMSRLLSKLPECFIVVEIPIHSSKGHLTQNATHFLQVLQTVCTRVSQSGSKLKVLGLTSKLAADVNLSRSGCDIKVTSLRPPTQVPARLRHLAQRHNANRRPGRGFTMR